MVNQLLKVSEVVEVLNLSKALVYRMIQDGELRAVRFRGAIRVRQEDLDAFIEAHVTVGVE